METPVVREDVDVTDSLLLSRPAFMDVRAPVEFNRGAVPGAVNLPILDDPQRAEIGTVYAEAGQDAAIARGLELATPAVRGERLEAWQRHTSAHPDGYLYCFRGGLRSRTTQAWLAEAGVKYPLVRGGYKALRNHCLNTLETLGPAQRLIVVSGQTGCGKTDLIHDWHSALDLEGLANHRGSAFGGTFTPQPSQIDFENALALAWLTQRVGGSAPVLIEAESHLIGRLYVPDTVQQAMREAPHVRLIASHSDRIQRLRSDYVDHALAHCQQSAPEDPWGALSNHVSDNLQRIKRRLGGATTDRLVVAVPGAVDALQRAQDPSGFDPIINTLLVDYYDKLYQHKTDQQQSPPVFTGSHSEILAWLEAQA